MNYTQASKQFIPSNVRRLGGKLRYHIRRYAVELVGIILNIRLNSVCQILLCYINAKSNVGFTEIAVRGIPQPVRLRNATSDFKVFRQVFLERQYDLLAIESSEYVIDAGANIGLTSLYMFSRNPSLRIIAVEPDSENFALASHNLKPYEGRCHLLHAALWSEDATLGLRRATDGGYWGSQTTTEFKNCVEMVPAYSVQTLLVKFEFPRIDILKIDIEGAELSVFRDADTSFMVQTSCCVVECHGQACEREFITAATRHGFHFYTSGELTVATRMNAHQG